VIHGSSSKLHCSFFNFETPKKLVLYDTTLRDGAQTPHVNFSLEDKLSITQKLSDFGIPYIEGGWPSSNPRDREYFKKVRDLSLNSKIVAFGMTSKNPKNDKNIEELIKSEADVITIFGKSSQMHVKDILRISLEKNLEMISETIDYLISAGFTVFYDAEHFFDGYKENSDYALQTLEAAKKAKYIILCDTNGGSLPWEVYNITKEVSKKIKNSLGIHAHNDSGLALANTLQAINFVEQVQGTINGLGERCGNLDFCEFLPIVQLKLGIKVVDNLEKLMDLSKYVERLTGFSVPKNKPFVGENAFTHKAGVHVDGVMKNSKSYEHIDPKLVGNRRAFTLSEQSGRANILVIAKQYGYNLSKDDKRVVEILKMVKNGRSFSDTDVFLLLCKKIDKKQDPFKILDYKVITTINGRAEALIKIKVGGKVLYEKSRGVGPVHALDLALRKALRKFFDMDDVKLVNYKVRILNEEKATAATVEVFIEFKANSDKWYTIASSSNIIKASGEALVKGYKYYLLRRKDKILTS